MPIHEKDLPAEDVRASVIDVYLAVTDDDDGDEVVLTTGIRKWPLVAFDDTTLPVLERYSQQAAHKFGKPVRIIRFTERSIHANYAPVTTGDE